MFSDDPFDQRRNPCRPNDGDIHQSNVDCVIVVTTEIDSFVPSPRRSRFTDLSVKSNQAE